MSPLSRLSGRVGGLLARGLIAGLVAGLLAAAFAAVVGEPSIERAIAYESAAEEASGQAREPELVSRAVQSREGLLAAGVLYGAAIGGLFGLAFALAYGRLGRLGPVATTAVLAGAGFLAIAFVPALKYPANPPAVGDPATIGIRTGLYFTFILVSVCALAVATAASRPLRRSLGSAAGSLAALGLFTALIATAWLALPAAEAPSAEFPSDLIATFRLASLGTRAVLWTALGIGFALALPRQDI